MKKNLESRIVNTRSNRKVRESLLWFFLFILLAFGGIMAWLIYVATDNHESYTKAVLSQQSYSSTVIPSKRGTIYDRNGVVLAKSTTVYNAILDPAVILSRDYYYEPSVEAICSVFGYDREELEKTINTYSKRNYVVYEKNVEYEKVRAFNELKASKKRVVGLWFEEETKRSYPNNSLASHVIGFVRPDGDGSYGIEQYYNDILEGTDGLSYGYFDQELNFKNTVKDKVDGADLVLCLDSNIQEIIEKKIREFNEETGSNNIGIIVMDPNSGELLGMACNNEYNLNNPRSLEGIVDSVTLENMSDEDKVELMYRTWKNFCVTDSFEPGSTYKTITVASALEENAITEKDTFECEGFKEVGGWTINCNNKFGHGTLTLPQALMKSCNCALMEIAEKLGSDRFFYYQNLFGFGRKTGIDIAGEASGIVISRKNLNDTELATSSFGTTFNVTMIQVAGAYASIINGGTYYTPHFVKTIEKNDGSMEAHVETAQVRQTVSNSTSEFIRDALYLTVENGTATPAKVAGYVVGGKTGTAQKRPREEKKYVVSFCGFAPVSDPKLMVYIVMDEIHDENLAGSSSPATKMFSSIMEEVLPYIGLYPEGSINYHIDEELLQYLDAEEEQAFFDPDALPAELSGIDEEID